MEQIKAACGHWVDVIGDIELPCVTCKSNKEFIAEQEAEWEHHRQRIEELSDAQ